MEPKDKAEELFNKINDLIPIEASFNDNAHEANRKILQDFNSTKNICIVIVDEMIDNTFSKINSWNKWKITPVDQCTTEYWKEVKSELIKLK